MADFDRGMLLRAVNALKSARLLLEEAHWEFAAAPTRQLFELLVNLEFLNISEDREHSAFLFTKYGLLQTIRAQLTTAEYARRTGRSVDEERVRSLARMLEVDYLEFRTKGGNYQKSWSGKTTRDLAAQSTQQPLRLAQYQQLFVAWSEQLHAAPAALLDAFFPRRTVQEVVTHDDARVAEIAAMSVVLFVELWRQLPSIRPLNPETTLGWQQTLMREAHRLGAVPSSE